MCPGMIWFSGGLPVSYDREGYLGLLGFLVVPYLAKPCGHETSGLDSLVPFIVPRTPWTPWTPRLTRATQNPWTPWLTRTTRVIWTSSAALGLLGLLGWLGRLGLLG